MTHRGWWTLSQNFWTPALRVWEWWFVKDLTYDMGHLTFDMWHLTLWGWWIASKFQVPSTNGLGVIMLWRFVKCDMWHVSCDKYGEVNMVSKFKAPSSYGLEWIICWWFDMWHVTCNMWHVTGDMWHMTSDLWHLTCDMWHMTLWG